MTDDIVTEAKAKFDLTERLRGRGLRTGEITLYLDEVNGEKLGWARPIKNQLGITINTERVGVLGEIDALDPKSETYDADLERLSAERDAIIAEIKQSGITVHLRAVPPVIAKSHEREAKKRLNIKGKTPEDQQNAVAEVQYALLYVDTVTGVTDSEGADSGRLDYDGARALIDYLPTHQLLRLREKVLDIQFGDAIDESIQAQTDF